MRPTFTAVVCGQPGTPAILESLGARCLRIHEDVLTKCLRAEDSFLECDIFVIEPTSGLTLNTETWSRAMRVVAAIRELPDYCTMRTGVRWNTVPIVLLGKDHLIHEIIHLERLYKRLSACSLIDGVQRCYLEIGRISAQFARELLGDMQSVGWVTVQRMGRYHRVRCVQERHLFGKSERTSELYDLEADSWSAMSDAERRMYSFIADDDEVDAVAQGLNAYNDMIRTPGLREEVCQQFFEAYPNLFQVARHELVPHPESLRVNHEKIIPDFVVRGQPAVLNSSPRIIEIKTPAMRLISGKDENRARFASPTMNAIAQVRDYGRWTMAPENARAVTQIFGVSNVRRLEVIGGMANTFNREILARERGYVNDVRIRTFDEVGNEMEHRHTATPSKAGMRSNIALSW